jgi:hypothetical protein
MGTAATQCSVQAMLFGIERHRGMIWFRFFEGLTIALLGAAALRMWGLVGLALVAAITQLLINMVLIPRHLCRTLDLPLTTYLKEACIKPCLLAVPLAGVLLAVHSVLMVATWPALVLALLITMVTYGLLVAFLIFGSTTATKWFSLEVFKAVEERFGIRRVESGAVVAESA